MKAALIIPSIIFTIAISKAQDVPIGSTTEYAKYMIDIVTNSKPNIEKKMVYQDGEVIELILEVSNVYSYYHMQHISYAQRYILENDTVKAIIDHYYEISTDNLKISAKENAMECPVFIAERKTWFVQRDKYNVNAVYLDESNGLATNMMVNLESPLIPQEIRKQIEDCINRLSTRKH